MALSRCTTEVVLRTLPVIEEKIGVWKTLMDNLCDNDEPKMKLIDSFVINDIDEQHSTEESPKMFTEDTMQSSTYKENTTIPFSYNVSRSGVSANFRTTCKSFTIIICMILTKF